jgi:hypothetical protein
MCPPKEHKEIEELDKGLRVTSYTVVDKINELVKAMNERCK